MKNGKRIVSAMVASALVLGTGAAFAMPANTIVMGDKAYDLNYAAAANNKDEINKAFADAGFNFGYKGFTQSWVDAFNKTVDSSTLPQVTYKDAAGATSTYAAKDGEVVESELKVESISAINITKVKVTFNVPVASFTAANISATGLTFSNPQLAPDGLSATVTVAGANFEESHNIKVSGVATASGNVADDYTQTVKFGTVNDYYQLKFTFDAQDTNENTVPDISANGATNVKVTAKVYDLENNPVNDAEGVIRFATTRGGIAQPEKTLQNGEASIQLTSESSLSETIYANISATIIGDYALEGLTSKTIVEFIPPSGEAGPSGAVPVVRAESNQADRFFITLGQSKPGLTADQLTDIANAITVNDGIKGALGAAEVKEVKQVSEKVLEVILDTDTNDTYFLTDNAKHNVTFAAVNDVLMASNVDFVLTDTTKQFVLDVKAIDQRTLEVKYSEPVAFSSNPGVTAYDANNFANYAIDGDTLDPTTTFELSTDRKTVTIHLAAADRLVATDDNLEVKNVGDWAGATDLANRISTQRIEYPVNIDNSVPTATITRQSPEQFVMDFNKPVKLDSAASIAEAISIYYGVDTTPADGIKDTAFDSNAAAGTQGITFTAYDENGAVVADPTTGYFTSILMEMNADWTNADGTRAAVASYWTAANPLQFVAPANAFVSEIGNKTVAINSNVANDRDRTSPVVVSNGFVQDKTAQGEFDQTAHVTMSEPVQLIGLTEIAPGTVQTTPNAEQTADNGDVQAGEIKFEKDGIVVAGQFNSVEDNDYTYEIQPVGGFAALRAANQNAAGTWKVSITGISDDYGNTMATQEFDFVVPAVAGAIPMEVEPEVMYAQYTADDDFAGGGSGSDVIRVKFTEVMSNSGANAVGDTTNYVLNGKTLAEYGSSVRKGISGVTEDWDGITITLPAGTLGNDANFVLNVASNLQSNDGQSLVGENELNLTDTDLAAPATATSLYNASILVNDLSETIVAGAINDNGADDVLNAAADTITVDFSAIDVLDVEQVMVNGTVIPASNLTVDAANSNEVVINFNGLNFSYDTNDRIEVKVNGQTVYVVVK